MSNNYQKYGNSANIYQNISVYIPTKLLYYDPFFLLKNKTLSQAMSHHIMLLNINLFLKVFWDPRTYISIFVFVSWCIFLLLILFNYLEFGNTIKETQFIYLDA